MEPIISIQVTFKIGDKDYGGTIPISSDNQNEAYIKRQGHGIVDAAIRTLKKENIILK